ncbi:MAG TPA: hypothetical protein VEY91_02830 [Candidatus Limnocylindria bacterium]|nr:hypothetical protein [Candidatus Limnocylindria bacterium]
MNVRAVFALALAFAGTVIPHATDGCGPDLPYAVFTLEQQPDAPEAFAAGRLGVLHPTYRQRYLAIAYRRLRGLSLDRSAQRAALGLPDSNANAMSEEASYWQWVELRRQYPGADSAVGFGVYRSVSDAESGQSFDYTNCQRHALVVAAATMTDRAQRFGPESLWFADWLRAQDRVLAKCSAPGLMPEPAPAGAPALLQADRAYQIAAAHFYLGELDEAARRFSEIARDQGSPWRRLAPYLVARALTRKGTLIPAWRGIDTTALAAAEAQAQRVLADPALRESHADTRRLIGFIGFRLRPAERLRELCRGLTAARPAESFRQDVVDFTLLLDRVRPSLAESLAAKSRDYDLADWMLTFQGSGPGARRHALERWRNSRSLPWLVAAARHVRGIEDDAEAVLRACANVKERSPAFATLQFHRVRLLAERGQRDEARAVLDRLLTADRSMSLAAARSPWSSSGLNLLLAQRLKLVRSLEEFLDFAPRLPAGVGAGWATNDATPDTSLHGIERAFAGPELLDADAATVLNRNLSLATLTRIATREGWPRHLRAEVALAAWVRAVLLDRDEAALALAPAVETLLPQTRSRLERYRSVAEPAARRFEAALLMLDFPGAKPSVAEGVGRLVSIDRMDPYRDNWWCAASSNDEDAGLSAHDVFGIRRYAVLHDSLSDTAWLTEGEREQAREEVTRLADVESGPSFLCRQVVAWGRDHRDDPRVPRALHLAVQSTRYGCHDSRTTAQSRAAFQLLHRRYPDSEWARKTPYYF